jgi:hypothetical protein
MVPVRVLGADNHLRHSKFVALREGKNANEVARE